MIVDPDFLDHWRTRMLVDMLDDECAPMYIIRLWGHCQNRREWVFDGMPVQATKAICRYQGDAEQFEKALIDCGFLSRNDDEITIVGWDEHNASLIANWANGARGGRPKGSTKETRKKPTGKPKENPSDNPSGTDKIGLDRMGQSKDNVASKDATSDYSDEFEAAWKAYPKRHTSSNKKAAYKQWKARLNNGFMPDDMMRGIERYAKFCKAEKQLGTKFVKMPETFLGPNEHFMEEWKASESKPKTFNPMRDDSPLSQLDELKRNLGMR